MTNSELVGNTAPLQNEDLPITGRILPVVKNDTDPDIDSRPRQFSDQIRTVFEETAEQIHSALADWVDFAGQMENSDGTNQIAAQLEFPLKNDCSFWHQQMFGNRNIWERDRNGRRTLDRQANPVFLEATDEQLKNSRQMRFKAHEALRYWETRKTAYIQKAKDDGYFDVIDDDIEYANTTVRHANAVRWYNLVRSFYLSATKRYELITGTEFDYEPYTERQPPRQTTESTMKLAASLRHK